jgi:hypothetical protein
MKQTAVEFLEEQIISLEVNILEDGRIVLDFYSDFEKPLNGFILTPKILLEILKKEKQLNK